MASRLFAAAVLVAIVAGCTGTSSRPATISGTLPLCYGPGPGASLWPSATIGVYQNDRLVLSRTFPSSDDHTTYTFRLAAGSYEMRMDHGYTIKVRALPGVKTRADWPQPGCL